MAKRNETGKDGESVARAFLEKQGYTLWYLFYQGQFCSGLLETDGSQLLFETVFSAAHFLRQ